MPRKAKWRDPDKPKRPFSAYNFLAQEIHADVKKSMPSSAKATEIMTAIAARWSSMSTKQKKPYQAKANAAKAKHGQEMAIYLKKKKNGETQKAPRRKRDKTKPRRAMSAYLFFGRDHRDQVKASFKEDRPPVTAVMTKLAEMWRAFPDSKKKKYNVLAAKAKAEYDVAIVKWRSDQKLLKAQKAAAPKPKKARGKKKKQSASEGMRV